MRDLNPYLQTPRRLSKSTCYEVACVGSSSASFSLYKMLILKEELKPRLESHSLFLLFWLKSLLSTKQRVRAQRRSLTYHKASKHRFTAHSGTGSSVFPTGIIPFWMIKHLLKERKKVFMAKWLRHSFRMWHLDSWLCSSEYFNIKYKIELNQRGRLRLCHSKILYSKVVRMLNWDVVQIPEKGGN